jgi:hypothetical protein
MTRSTMAPPWTAPIFACEFTGDRHRVASVAGS